MKKTSIEAVSILSSTDYVNSVATEALSLRDDDAGKNEEENNTPSIDSKKNKY